MYFSIGTILNHNNNSDNSLKLRCSDYLSTTEVKCVILKIKIAEHFMDE